MRHIEVSDDVKCWVTVVGFWAVVLGCLLACMVFGW